MATVKKPLLIYDGDCNFCRRWVARWRLLTGSSVDYAPFQLVASQFPQIKPEAFAGAVQLIDPSGRSWSGAEAVFRVLAHAPEKSWLLPLYENLPPFARVSDHVYRTIARNRAFYSRLTRWLWGDVLYPPTYHGARWLFLRALGVIYLAAFVSLAVQVDGLIGSQGILPARDFLEAVRAQLGSSAYRALPTLCWLNASGAFLRFLCWGGAGLSLLLILGLAQGPVLLLLWAFYLSLTYVGQDFLSFQWDILLIEAGFLAVFFAPWRLWPGSWRTTRPSPAILWLLRFLLFRLMLESGLVKLLSGDRTWRDLTALTYHYYTQPLPTWIGWYANLLPQWFQEISVALVFLIELGAPFLILLPRRPRMLGGAALVFLQVLIFLTGNYCFFNLLALALCLLLLDDAFLRRALPKAWSGHLEGAADLPPSPPWARRMRAALAALILLIGGLQLSGMLLGRMRVPIVLSPLFSAAEPLRIVNTYGLFAVMTTARLEISIEGSDDGKTWKEYPFKWKPGDLRRRPAFVEPHQPRLDWQMWFAALGSYRESPWFPRLLARLLEGSPTVLALFESNPFPQHPPRFIRCVAYDYHFTDLAQKRATGAWWRREKLGLYTPVFASRR